MLCFHSCQLLAQSGFPWQGPHYCMLHACSVQCLTACMLTEHNGVCTIITIADRLTVEVCTLCLLITADLRPSMGDPKSDFIVTMHCVVRAAGFGKSAGLHLLLCPSHAQCGGASFLCGHYDVAGMYAWLGGSTIFTFTPCCGVAARSKDKEKATGCCLVQ